MRYLTFTYTDAKQKVTQRKVLEIAKPQPHYFCIDVSELGIEESVDLQEELYAAEQEAKAVREAIMQKYDVSKNYRYFKPENITNLIED